MKKINDKGFVRTAIKSVITFSTMLAVNDIFGYFAPTRTSQTLHRVGNNISGMCVGYFVGEHISDMVLDNIEKAIKAYKGEEEGYTEVK